MNHDGRVTRRATGRSFEVPQWLKAVKPEARGNAILKALYIRASGDLGSDDLMPMRPQYGLRTAVYGSFELSYPGIYAPQEVVDEIYRLLHRSGLSDREIEDATLPPPEGEGSGVVFPKMWATLEDKTLWPEAAAAKTAKGAISGRIVKALRGSAPPQIVNERDDPDNIPMEIRLAQVVGDLLPGEAACLMRDGFFGRELQERYRVEVQIPLARSENPGDADEEARARLRATAAQAMLRLAGGLTSDSTSLVPRR